MSELLWTDQAWLEEATLWIRATLGRLGIPMRGQIEQVRVRPWATALRVPTESGDVWFKASIPVLAHVGLVPRRELLAVFPLARRLGKLCRAFSYHLTIPKLPLAHRAEYADGVPAWLQIFLLDN